MRNYKFTFGFTLSMVAAALIIFTACRKNKNTAEDITYASDHAVSEQTFNDVQAVADLAATNTSGTLGYKGTGSGCATVTHTPGNIVIDFGSTNCLCHDGRYRRGQILVSYSGNYADSGSVHTITFNNFYQNDNKITGTKTVTNIGHNSLGQPCFTVTINGSVTHPGGGTITSTWSRTRTWTAGYNTTDNSDDVYEISGSGTMTRANGNIISINITTPLVVANNCHWIEAGTVTYSLSGNIKRTLNYGDTANCDDAATVTLANGTVKTITLP